MFLKKCVLLGVLLLFLTGCGSQETFETVADVLDAPAAPQPRQILVDLPGEEGQEVLETPAGQLYLSEDYEIGVEVLSSGDLDATLKAICGRKREELTVMETAADGVKRYEFVWAAAGENGDQLGRGTILDDGNYHYCLTVQRPAEGTGDTQIVWSQVFSSFSLA